MVVGGLWIMLRYQQLIEGALLLAVGLQSQNHASHAVVRRYRADIVPVPRQTMTVAGESDSALVINQADAVSRAGGEETLCGDLARNREVTVEQDADQD